MNEEPQTLVCPRCEVIVEYPNDAETVGCPKCGVTVPNPFSGTLMECVVCGKKEFSHPKVRSQWRAYDIGLAGKRKVTFHACPAEFPQDGATRNAYQEAHARVLEIIRKKFGV